MSSICPLVLLVGRLVANLFPKSGFSLDSSVLESNYKSITLFLTSWDISAYLSTGAESFPSDTIFTKFFNSS